MTFQLSTDFPEQFADKLSLERCTEGEDADEYSARRIVAKVDIGVGELIFAEDPFAQVSMPLCVDSARGRDWSGDLMLSQSTKGDFVTPFSAPDFRALFALEYLTQVRPEMFLSDEWMDEFVESEIDTKAEEVYAPFLKRIFRAERARKAGLGNRHTIARGVRWMRIWDANSLRGGDAVSRYWLGEAMYRWASAFNHSCVPNAHYTVVKGQRIEVRTCLPVKAGDELTISYAEQLPYIERYRMPLRVSAFDCRCSLCARLRELPPDERRLVSSLEVKMWRAIPEDLRLGMSLLLRVNHGSCEETLDETIRSFKDQRFVECALNHPLALSSVYARVLNMATCVLMVNPTVRIGEIVDLLKRAAVIARLAITRNSALLTDGRDWSEYSAMNALVAQTALMEAACTQHAVREAISSMDGNLDKAAIETMRVRCEKTTNHYAEFGSAVLACGLCDTMEAACDLLERHLAQLLVLRAPDFSTELKE